MPFGFHLTALTWYVRLAALTVGVLVMLINLHVPELHDRGEYFSMILFSLAGITLTAGADDFVTLFLALELVSVPTYALVAAGSVKFEDALVLVKKRGELMEEASNKNPGKMACVIGMDINSVEALCKGIGCEIANLNCPGQVVVSGKTTNVELFAGLAKEKGAKRVLMLDVSGPFHSSLMTTARDKLKDYIEKIVRGGLIF